MSTGDNVQGVLGAIGPFWAKWGVGRIPRSPSFFVRWSRGPCGKFATADFHQIWSRIVVRCPVAESWKTFSKIFTLGVICPKIWNRKSVKQAPHSEQAISNGMHCRDILFTPHCSPRARTFPWAGQLLNTTYDCGATGRQICPIFGLWPIFPIQNPS